RGKAGGRRWLIGAAAVGALLALGWAFWPRGPSPQTGPTAPGDGPGARLEARREVLLRQREARDAAVGFCGSLHAAGLAGAAVRAELPSFVNSVGMKMILIKPDRFLMGSPDSDKDAFDSEKPRHEVEISKAFYLAECKVTQEQYKRVTGKNPSYFSADGDGKER